MTMKRTDLAKSKFLKVHTKMRQASTPERFGEGAAALPDRREQRKLDQAAGLVPFAVKLKAELVQQLHAQAQERGVGINELVGELLEQALARD